MRTITRNPYAGINWETTGRYKADMHMHTTQSDGGESPEVVIDSYVEYGFDIISITDHDVMTWPWSTWGRDPAALGVLAVPGSEISLGGGHRGATWFTDTPPATAPTSLATLKSSGAHFRHNHPPTGGGDPNYLVPLLGTYKPNYYGVEVYNKGGTWVWINGWDKTLTKLATDGNGGTCWGVSGSDCHNTVTQWRGENFNTYFMESLTYGDLEAATLGGTYTFTWDPLGRSLSRHVPAVVAPSLDSLTVSASAITIEASNTSSVAWFTSTTAAPAPVGTGPVLSLDNPLLGEYARAELYGADGAITHTQPIYLSASEAPPTIDRRRGAIAAL